MTERLDSFAVHLALGGSYYQTALDLGVYSLWPLNELLQSTTARVQGVGPDTDTGVYVDCTLGVSGPFPHGGTACQFNGSTSHVDLGDLNAYEFSTGNPFTVAFVGKWTTAAACTVVSKRNAATAGGWTVHIGSGQVGFFADTNAGVVVFNLASATATLNDGEYHSIFASWDGTTGANGVKIYIDGVLDAQGTAGAGGAIGTNAARLLFGAADAGGGTESAHFAGTMAGVAIGVPVSSVATLHAATQWTDVTDDVIVDKGLSLEYGTAGVQPLDRLANAGSLEFSLDNSEHNSAGLQGYYAPSHASVRTGFTFSIPVRVLMTYGGTTRTKFWGRVHVIDPEPGENKNRLTHVLANDYMLALNETDIREVTARINIDDRDALLEVIEAMPNDLQPMAVDLDPALDTFAYVFDDLQGGRKATTVLQKLIISGWGRGYVLGDGTFRWLNRSATTNQIIDFDLDDTHLIDIQSPSDRGQIFDRVRAISHPKQIDAAATSDLFVHPGIPLVAAAGGVLELWGEYRNPANDKMTVGGTAMVTPVSGTDFIANSAADGSGSNLTADVTMSADYFGSTVKLTLTNNHATLDAHFTTLKVRGKGIYDLAPVTSEAVGIPGTRPLTVDLPYQDDGNIGQEIADFILQQREAITTPVEQITINPHKSADMMALALDGDADTLMTITESQIGLVAAQAAIRSVRLELGEGEVLTAILGLMPILVGYQWLLGDAAFSILDETTVFA